MADGLRFTVGEQPDAPLVIALTNHDGTPADLSGYSTLTLTGEGVPAGTLAVADAAAGTVQYVFTAPFAVAGLVEATVRADGDVFPALQFQVTPIAVLRVSGAQAFTQTGAYLSASHLRLAQAQVAAFVDRDLSDPLVWDAISGRDQALLRSAISWQATDVEASESGEVRRPHGVAAMSSGDQSVTFEGAGGAGGGGQVSTMAVSILKRLSWHQKQLESYVPHRSRIPSGQWLADHLNGVR